MSQFVTTHFVQQYTTNVQILAQQKGSRFRRAVTVGNYVGKQGVPVDQFAPTVANKRSTRYPSLTPADTQTDRRWVFPSDYDWNDLIDNIDKLRLLIDPQSAYVMNGMNAMARAMDDEIIGAFFADAKTGPTGANNVTFAGNGLAVSASEGASAATGLNVEKLKAGMQQLMAAEAWDPGSGDRLYCAVTAKQNRNLMDEIQVINQDYNPEKSVIQDGFVMSWGKIDFIHSERLTASGGQTLCPLWVKEGMHLGLWQDLSADVSQRKDLAGLPWQVYLYGTFGGTRIQEKMVVQMPCA